MASTMDPERDVVDQDEDNEEVMQDVDIDLEEEPEPDSEVQDDGKDAQGRRRVAVPLSSREKAYGAWFIFKSCVSITVLVISLVLNQRQISSFYDGNEICDSCYRTAYHHPSVLFEFNICGNTYNNFTTIYVEDPSKPPGPIHVKYDSLINLLWTPGSDPEQGNSAIIVIGIIDWVVIMYFTLNSVNQVRKAIQTGNDEDKSKVCLTPHHHLF